MWSIGQYLWVWLLCCIPPYGMYVVAYVLEGRKPGNGPDDIPVWRDQSRAFLPGDFGLAFTAASGFALASQGVYSWMAAWWWYLLAATVSMAAYYLGRKVLYVPADYTPQAWNCPTKRWHDIVMFVLFPFVAIGWALPGCISQWSVANASFIAVGAAGLLLWIAGMVADAKGNNVPNPRQHPTVRAPIWRT